MALDIPLFSDNLTAIDVSGEKRNVEITRTI
jgi:hypothetical protein